MPGYNTSFELSVEDLALIEDALLKSKLSLTQARLKENSKELPADDDARQIHELLGRLHNQKAFYRPRQGAFISG
jgi:hypothetical protein